jgi:hypothetical protein
MTRFALLELTYWLGTIIANQLSELELLKPSCGHQTDCLFCCRSIQSTSSKLNQKQYQLALSHENRHVSTIRSLQLMSSEAAGFTSLIFT